MKKLFLLLSISILASAGLFAQTEESDSYMIESEDDLYTTEQIVAPEINNLISAFEDGILSTNTVIMNFSLDAIEMQMSFTNQYIQLYSSSNDPGDQEKFITLTNIMKMLHDSAMAIIRNIR